MIDWLKYKKKNSSEDLVKYQIGGSITPKDYPGRPQIINMKHYPSVLFNDTLNKIKLNNKTTQPVNSITPNYYKGWPQISNMKNYPNVLLGDVLNKINPQRTTGVVPYKDWLGLKKFKKGGYIEYKKFNQKPKEEPKQEIKPQKEGKLDIKKLEEKLKKPVVMPYKGKDGMKVKSKDKNKFTNKWSKKHEKGGKIDFDISNILTL